MEAGDELMNLALPSGHCVLGVACWASRVFRTSRLKFELATEFSRPNSLVVQPLQSTVKIHDFGS
jgi:hypothetical protein